MNVKPTFIFAKSKKLSQRITDQKLQFADVIQD